MKKKEEKYYCAIDYAFKRIGGKYKGRILWQLHATKILRYGALKRAISDCTPKMLTQTLRELESDGFVKRKVYLEVPPKVEYSLNPEGEALIPFIKSIGEWGQEQLKRHNIKTIECD